jgi:AcrR family transcriptional regulator
MPTGIALRDARTQLLSAGERVLLRDGPAGLTSRAVTDEAEVAKGVLHRHFVTFDGFLAVLVQEQINTVNAMASDLLGRAGSGTVVGNLASALTELFQPLGLAVVRLVLSRSDLAMGLQTDAQRGIPVLSGAIHGFSVYLAAEQRAGRIVVSAAPDSLAHALIGTGHLLFAGELGGLPDDSAVVEIVEAIVVGSEPGAFD